MILATVYLVFPADVSPGQMLILFSYFVSFLWVILKIEKSFTAGKFLVCELLIHFWYHILFSSINIVCFLI